MTRPWPGWPRTSASGCTTGWCGPGTPSSTDRYVPPRARSSTRSIRSRQATPRHRRRSAALRIHGGLGMCPRLRTEAIQLADPVGISRSTEGPTSQSTRALSPRLLVAGWAAVDPPWEALFDLWLDPSEGNNRIDDPTLAGVAEDFRERLHDWMVRTGDPLIDGPVRPAEGTVINTVDQVSASDPTTPPSIRSLTHSRRARNVSETPD